MLLHLKIEAQFLLEPCLSPFKVSSLLLRRWSLCCFHFTRDLTLASLSTTSIATAYVGDIFVTDWPKKEATEGRALTVSTHKHCRLSVLRSFDWKHLAIGLKKQQTNQFKTADLRIALDLEAWRMASKQTNDIVSLFPPLELWDLSSEEKSLKRRSWVRF